jgi:hypothetical protein
LNLEEVLKAPQVLGEDGRTHQLAAPSAVAPHMQMAFGVVPLPR